MGTVDHTDISLPLKELDHVPKETIPSPFKGLRGAYTEVSVFPVSVVSCFSPATLGHVEARIDLSTCIH